MQKPNPLHVSLCISAMIHAVVLGAYGIYKYNASPPGLPQEDDVVTLNLVAAPEASPTPSPMVKVVTPVQPLTAKVPAVVPAEPVKQPPPPPIEPQPATLIPNQVAVVVAAAPPSFQGDASSPKPGQDATTEQARPEVKAQPNYLKNPEPVYPEPARRHHQQGVVVLAVTVSAQGRALTVEIKESSGFSLLDGAAEEAVRDWEFEPARIGSLALESKIEVPIRFQLAQP